MPAALPASRSRRPGRGPSSGVAQPSPRPPAEGPVEVYNSLQCLLSLGSCASLSSLTQLVPSVLGLLNNQNITHVQLTNVLNSLGINKSVNIDAAIVTNGHFGVQLPLLSPVANLSLLNNLIAINIDPPTLRLKGSLAQRYKGIMAADLIKLAMLAVHRRLAQTSLRAKMLLQIHDELVFEVPPDEIGEVSELVTREMSGVMQLAVPLKVDIKLGDNWAECEPWTA